MSTSGKKRIRVVAALLEETGGSGRFLVQQRLPNVSRANLWEFPGGKVEPGESDAQALARECREELEVELSVGALKWSTVHEYEDLIVELLLYAVRVETGTLKALGAQAIRFCSPSQMKELDFCEADLPLLEALARGELTAGRVG